MSELSDNKKVRELVEGAFGSDENPWISETGAETATFRIVRVRRRFRWRASAIFTLAGEREIVSEAV